MSSHERQTVDGIILSFNAMDIDTIIALRTPECQRVFLPSSLNYPPQSNDAYHANLLGMKSIFTSFHLEVTDLVEGTDMNGHKKIVVYLNAKGDTPVGEYKNEYVWKMGFDEQGFKVSSWEEYVDVGMTRDFYPKLRDEMVKRAQAGK